MRLPTRDQVRYHGIRWGWVVFLAALAYAAFPSSATNVAPLLEPGAVAEHDVIAPFTFPVNKSDEELAREAEELAGTVKPIYQFQDRALDSVRAAVRTFFSALETAADQGGVAALAVAASRGARRPIWRRAASATTSRRRWASCSIARSPSGSRHRACWRSSRRPT